jgi:hypothetical protein
VARGAHAQPLWAARGGASGLQWSSSLLCYAWFNILNNFHVDGFLKFGLLIDVKFNPKSDCTIYDLRRSDRWIVTKFDYDIKLLVLNISVDSDRRLELLDE